jgi:transcriptional regulator with XRE-family HTH domain
MGAKSREMPHRLGEKLLQIRNALGLSQTEMLNRLGIEDRISYKQISKYELGNSEPTLIILLQYARLAGIHMEALVDDEADLPEKLPGDVKQHEILRLYLSRSRSKRR